MLGRPESGPDHDDDDGEDQMTGKRTTMGTTRTVTMTPMSMMDGPAPMPTAVSNCLQGGPWVLQTMMIWELGGDVTGEWGTA